MSSKRHRLGGALAALALGTALAVPALAAAPASAATPQEVPQAPAATVEANGETIVHLFEWTWDSVAAECADFLGPNGFGGVQVSPPQEHVVIPSAEGAEYPWWQDYQPVSYRIDNTRRGTAEEFQTMVDTCRDNGVRIYVDAIINHMTGPGSGTGSAGTDWEYYDYPDLFGDGSAAYEHGDFEPCYDTISDWGDKWEVQNCQLLELSDLDTADPQVRGNIRRYLNGLVDMGVAGFRVDAAKHVPEAHVQDIFANLNDVPGFGGKPDVYYEVYGDATIPYTQYTFDGGRATNFDYQRDVAGKFADGDISGLANLPDYGGLSDDQATVFIDNHDTQRSAPALTHKDGERYYLATAFMLAHPYGHPKVMSSYDFHEEAQGPPSVGEVPGNPAGWITEDTDCSSAAWICEHRDPAVAGMAAFRNSTGDTAVIQRATDGNSRLAFDRGDRGFAAFNAGGGTWNLTVDTNLPDDTYENAAGNGSFTVSDGQVTVSVPANGAVALHVGGVCDDPEECDGGTGDTLSATVHTDYGQEVYVVGSTPELGSWTPQDGVRLTTDESSYPVWTGTPEIASAAEWKLVKVDGSGNTVWEEGDNRVGPPSGGVTWGSSGGGGTTCTTVATEFNVQAETHYGQEVYVVGSIPELGSWDPAGGLRLSTNEASYPWWGGSTELTIGTEFEYKYVKIDGSGNVEWTSGGNFVATSDDSDGGCTQAFSDHWS